VIVDEAILNECNEPRQMVWFADVTVREPADDDFEFHGAGGERFVLRTGRARSGRIINESMAPVFYKKIAFIAFFNAGVRALDIRDPYHPTEIGYFHPVDHGGDRTSAASPVRARIAARSRSRPIMSRPMSAAISTSSIAPTPAAYSGTERARPRGGGIAVRA